MTALQNLDFASPTPYCLSFVSGTLLHLLVFRVGEWDLYTPHLLAAPVLLFGAGTYGLSKYVFDEITPSLHSAGIVWLLLAACISGIVSSILVYRAAFHRLNRFPGPFLARISNFYVTSLSVKNFHLFEEVQVLHAKYGDIVRIGPSEISVADPKAYNLIHSNQSPCQKGPWYNILHPVQSLHMIRDRKTHAHRRKTWDKGLGSKALRDYEPRVEQFTQQLLSVLEKKQGLPVDVSTLFNFYSFDVMGDLAFDSGFNMLRDGIVHYYMESVHANMLAVSAFSHLVWIFPLLKAIPIVNNEHIKFQSWLKGSKKPERPDLFSWILADYQAIPKPTKQNDADLYGDAHLIIVAGSDTTAASLTCLFFQLAQNPAVLQKLQEELDKYFEDNKELTAASLSKLDYLNACINECLRLHPPIPSGVQRMTPPEGLQLGDTFIPGDTIVQVPTYTLHRDERAFMKPNEYIPDRWTSQTELVKDATVFTPFGTGRYSCAGKQLGLMELRSVTSQVVRDYDVRLDTDQKAGDFLDGCKDGFTLSTAKLKLVFSKRRLS
ncbi:cytochrome p450 domain-containing protein [Sarocladium implicatum]|nr:cytochrome p450 domain-containing protein [Sarocladium implicatum]